jgi:hypothetical protein
MSNRGRMWNVVLAMASLASGLLILPPEAKAEMIASRMQSGKVMELVRRQLCSAVTQQQIQRFGLRPSEARQLQTVFCDARVIEQMARVQSQVGRASRTTVIGRHATSRLLTALQSSVERHMGATLRQKLSKRAKGLCENETWMVSRLSAEDGTVNARKVLIQARRALTAEKLVALGMSETDAAQTVSKLKDSDVQRIFSGNLRIGYAAGVDWSSDGGLLLLLVIILGIVAILAGGPAVVLFIVVALIALVYFVAYEH